MGTDPTVAASQPALRPPSDTDRDGLPDAVESVLGTDPGAPDSDGDAIPDGVEVLRLGTSPVNANTDGDQCSDGMELASINGDTLVDATDQQEVAAAFGLTTSGHYVLDFDMDRDGNINSADLRLVTLLAGAC